MASTTRSATSLRQAGHNSSIDRSVALCGGREQIGARAVGQFEVREHNIKEIVLKCRTRLSDRVHGNRLECGLKIARKHVRKRAIIIDY